MKNKSSTWAELIKRLVDGSGLTARDFAKQAELSEGLISRILAGKRVPGADSLSKLLKAAGKKWKWIDDNLAS